jgi:hypothetical protein
MDGRRTDQGSTLYTIDGQTLVSPCLGAAARRRALTMVNDRHLHTFHSSFHHQ